MDPSARGEGIVLDPCVRPLKAQSRTTTWTCTRDLFELAFDMILEARP